MEKQRPKKQRWELGELYNILQLLADVGIQESTTYFSGTIKHYI
jgi:uncharacterized protein YjiS (DUF1127 family)